MIFGETFTVNIHNLSIDECINLLVLEQDHVLLERLKHLIIIKKLIKVISERDQISGYHPIRSMIHRIDMRCKKKFFTIQNNKYRDEELLRQFKEFQRIHSTCCDKKKMLFTVFYAERAIVEIYFESEDI